jgi:lactate permease
VEIALALAPFVIFILLLLWKRTSLLTASLISLGATVLTVIFYWQSPTGVVLSAFPKSFFIAFDIFLIILGAVFFLDILKKYGVIDNISHLLESFSKDFRVQVILLAWFFENFIEGTAGFGTPSAIVAPILVALGISPIRAVVIALLGNSTSVVFGAAGTPIRVGFAGLTVTGVPLQAALFNCVGLLVPVFMLWSLTRKEEDGGRKFREGLPFAIWSGVAFVVPSVFLTFLGQEFPSILGAVIGVVLVLVTCRLKIFMPKTLWIKQVSASLKTTPSLFKIAGPYLLLILLLIVGKITLGGLAITFDLLGPQKINLFNPGIAFILAAVPVVIWGIKNKKVFFDSVRSSFRKTLEPFAVIAAVSAVVQLMLNSGSLIYIARGFENVFLPLTAPIIGAFGSFLTGSATISNIMFGKLVAGAGQILNFNVATILALELVGAAAGNMIALADILAAETVLGLKNQEKEVLKGVIIPCLVYVGLVGLIALIAL